MTVLQFLQSLSWREPLLLWLGLYPALLLVLRRLCRRNRLQHYADKTLHKWVVISPATLDYKNLFSRTSLYVIAWLCLVIAAAGPRSAVEVPEQDMTILQDIYLVVDVSRSMHVSDLQPNRLRRARIELFEFLSRAENSRMSIIVYTANAHELIPLTYDKDVVSEYLELIDRISLPTYGSNPLIALSTAYKRAGTSGRPASILWLTDGDIDPDYSEPLQQLAANLAKADVPLYILNAGTVEGDVIPLDDGKWLLDNDTPVISRSNTDLLARLAGMTNGRYSQVQDDASDWQALYDNGMKNRFETDRLVQGSDDIQWREYYYYPLVPALVFLFIVYMPYPLPVYLFKRREHALALTVLLLILPVAAEIRADDSLAAYNHLEQQRYAEAIRIYENIPGYSGRFGHGVSAYRLADYSEAINQFTQAVLLANDDRQRANALYNLGNAYFNTGNYRAAIQTYRDVLRYDNSYSNARANLALSEKLAQDLELRLQQRRAKTDRLGRGPRSQTAADNVELQDFGAVSLDDSESTASPEGTSSQSYEILLEKGIEFADLAASGEDAADRYIRAQTLSEAVVYMQGISNQREDLWKRLFEIESGFAAPQDKPARVKGIKPW